MNDKLLFMILLDIGYLTYLLFIIITSIITLKRMEEKCRNTFSNVLMVFAEVMFTIIGPIVGFLRFDQYGSDIPFAKRHVLTIILLVSVSSLCFWLAKFTAKTAHPVIRIILSVGILQGIILCLFTTFHFLAFIPLGIIYPLFGFELLSPLIALILLIRELYFYNKTAYNLSELLPYREELGFVPFPYLLFQKTLFTRLIIYGALLIPFVTAQIMLAYGCGQDSDALVKAFTHSHGFIFSMSDY
jgi:hypothetical protein